MNERARERERGNFLNELKIDEQQASQVDVKQQVSKCVLSAQSFFFLFFIRPLNNFSPSCTSLLRLSFFLSASGFFSILLSSRQCFLNLSLCYFFKVVFSTLGPYYISFIFLLLYLPMQLLNKIYLPKYLYSLTSFFCP